MGAGVGEAGPRGVVAADEEYNGNATIEAEDNIMDPGRGGGVVSIGGEEIAKRIEDLDGVGSGVDLEGEMFDDGVGEFFEETVEEGGIGVEEVFGGSELGGAAALQHEIGESPWGAGETEECGVGAELSAEESERLRDVKEAFAEIGGIEAIDVGGGAEGGIHFDAAAITESVSLAEGFRDDEDIAEEDSGVEVEAMDGLEGDLCGEFRGADEFEEGVLLFERAVFGEGAAGLAHEPDGGMIERLSGAGGEETLARGQGWIGVQPFGWALGRGL